MANYNNENYDPNILSNSVSSMASHLSRSYDQNGKHLNSVSQIRNRESIMKVFVSDKEDINAINEVIIFNNSQLVWMDAALQDDYWG
jgi:hypothetical protein